MNNVKTAFIVVLLLGALYGAYQFLNARDVPPPPEVRLQQQQGIAPPTIEFGTPFDGDGPVPISAPPASAPSSFSPAELTAPEPGSTVLEPSSFSVTPDADEPKFDALTDADATTPPETASEAPRASAYSRKGANPPATDAFSSTQPNPFYRPGVKPASAARPAKDPRFERQVARMNFERGWNDANDQVKAGKLREALATLSAYYDSPELTADERKQLLRTLDLLAGRVIYSTEHYLAEPHEVRSGETLVDIAARYNVPHTLLQNINGIKDPLVLVPKTKLKVVRGPFHADVNLQESQLALFVGDDYAGRFAISVGQEPLPPEGEYTVRMKREGKDYYPRDGRTVPLSSASNPYGQHWIDLGDEVCIHGSAAREVPPTWGCISLSPIDAADVYGILSVGSKVRIHR